MQIFRILKNAFDFFFYCPKDLPYLTLEFDDRKCGQGAIA